MPILDEDGRPLRQPSPNPLMVGQDRGDKWEMLNPGHEEVVVSYGAKEEVVPRFMEIVEGEDAAEAPLAKASPQARKVVCDCLPGIASRQDDLYGDSTPRFGPQFRMEVYVLEDTDMVWRAWTNVVVGTDSIIFVPHDKRWWRVVQSQGWRGGQLLDCLPSERKPDFQG